MKLKLFFKDEIDSTFTYKYLYETDGKFKHSFKRLED